MNNEENYDNEIESELSIIRFHNGEDIIGEVVKLEDGLLEVKNPLFLLYIPMINK